MDCYLTELICEYSQLSLERSFEFGKALTLTEQNWEDVTALKPRELS